MNHKSLNINMDMGSLDIDHISNMRREFFFNKDYEWWDQPKKGDVVVDVGTCVGMFSCLALDSGASKVYMIEPNRSLLETAIKNTDSYTINAKERMVIPCHAAIMNNKHMIQHVYNSGSAGNFVPLTFREFIDFYEIEKIDYLKVDCEGGEYDIFTKENFDWIYENVGHIAVEVHRRHSTSGPADITKFRDEFLVHYEKEGKVKYQHESIANAIWNDEWIQNEDFSTLPAEFMVYFTNRKK
jgi:FkbM family methyltransferase